DLFRIKFGLGAAVLHQEEKAGDSRDHQDADDDHGDMSAAQAAAGFLLLFFLLFLLAPRPGRRLFVAPVVVVLVFIRDDAAFACLRGRTDALRTRRLLTILIVFFNDRPAYLCRRPGGEPVVVLGRVSSFCLLFGDGRFSLWNWPFRSGWKAELLATFGARG